MRENKERGCSERVTLMVLGGLRVVSIYQPVWGTEVAGIGEIHESTEGSGWNWMESYANDLMGRDHH